MGMEKGKSDSRSSILSFVAVLLPHYPEKSNGSPTRKESKGCGPGKRVLGRNNVGSVVQWD